MDKQIKRTGALVILYTYAVVMGISLMASFAVMGG